jgi:hypothetical protein
VYSCPQQPGFGQIPGKIGLSPARVGILGVESLIQVNVDRRNVVG